MKLSENIQNKLRCPVTNERLNNNGDYLESAANPDIRYPVIDNIPVLINNERSLFSIDDFVKRVDTTFYIMAIIPGDSKILVIGGSIKGQGMEEIYSNKSYEIIGSDVSFDPYSKVISDAYDIPFEDQTFDCVIVQAVLEHVLDPARVVSEIHRTLKTSGIVYADTLFMQQVHMKQYDFTRFTHLGHRRLFREFEEINSGPSCGPGMALAWAYKSFILSFTKTRWIECLLLIFIRYTSFYLKYFDYYLIDKPGSYDSASGYYFIGRKSNSSLKDKELIASFKGVR